MKKKTKKKRASNIIQNEQTKSMCTKSFKKIQPILTLKKVYKTWKLNDELIDL